MKLVKHKYILASSDEDYTEAKKLFREYAALIHIDLAFQKFEEELSGINKMYSPPTGGIILCKSNEIFAGCIAIRKLDDNVCELKRMYVNPNFQGKSIGKNLLEKALQLAREYNYKLMRLDTLTQMLSAIHLYKQYGFYEIEPYYFNPNATAVFFEKKLKE
ncbi:MAG: GNAT family N-acetyltransferase [Ginsengibacter sp.]